MFLITVLKVVGRLLLAVLLFLLIVILYLMFCPISYEFRGQCRETSGRVRFTVSGFLRFFQFCVQYDDGKLRWRVSAMWGKCRLLPRGRAGEKSGSHQEGAKEADGGSAPAAERADDAAERQDRRAAREEQTAERVRSDIKAETKKAGGEAEKVLTDPVDGSGKDDDGDEEKESAVRRLRGLYDNILHPDFRDAVAFLWERIVWLFRNICPRKLEADCVFSLGDPALTGLFTGLLSLCPASYGEGVHLIPDFSSEQPVFRGWIRCRGHIFLIWILWFGVRIFLHKSCRKLFHIS